MVTANLFRSLQIGKSMYERTKKFVLEDQKLAEIFTELNQTVQKETQRQLQKNKSFKEMTKDECLQHFKLFSEMKSQSQRILAY